MPVATPAGSPAIEVRGLTKSFGTYRVLRSVNLTVNPGESVVVFGPNGAGKTTLIRILSTLLKATSGQININGLDLQSHTAEVRRTLGLVSHQTFLYEDLTAAENLKFYGKLYDVPDLSKRILEILELVGLTAKADSQARTLSRGMQQRLTIARAIIHNPSLILLDEPETGLDQNALAMLGEVLHGLNGGKSTIVMTTHSLEYGLKLCQHVVIIAGGKVAFEEVNYCGDVPTLRETYRQVTGGRQ